MKTYRYQQSDKEKAASKKGRAAIHKMKRGEKETAEKRMITVCDACLQASCWQGIFMCDKSRDAGTVEKSIEELQRLDLEHSDYWKESE